MRYIETGGAGFIGSHITKGLVSEGHELITIDDLSSGRKKSIEHFLDTDKVQLYQSSITNLTALIKYSKGNDGILPDLPMKEAMSVDPPRSSYAVSKLTGEYYCSLLSVKTWKNP